MKKLLFAISIAAIMCGCDPSNDKGSRRSDVVYNYERFEFEGHAYIRFSERDKNLLQDDRMSVVHDPDCNCHRTNYKKGIVESKIFHSNNTEKK